MKRIFTFYFLILSVLSFGQNNSKFHHKLSQKRIDDAGFILRSKTSHYTKDSITVDDLKKMYIGKGIVRSCILTTDGKGGIAVDFWRIKDSINDKIDTIVNRDTKTLNFTLTDGRKKIGDPTKVLKVPFRAWTWSVGTTPVRYRLKTDSSNATVSTALSISISYGRTWGKSIITSRAINNKSVTLAPFLGLVSADLKKETVTNPKTWEANKTTTQTNVAFSYGVGVTLARNNLGLVISVGYDHLMGDKSEFWSYQDLPWIGLGINTNLGILK
jgi:hypothetical protein